MIYDSHDKHFRRLSEVVDYSYLKCREDRKIHQLLIRHTTGEYYPTEGGFSGIPTSINLLSLAQRGMIRATMSKAPRMLVNGITKKDAAWLEDAEIAANERLVSSNFDDVLYEVSRQSMVSFGILYLGADYIGTKNGMKLDLVAKSIDRADFVHDIDATELESSDYVGHKFRMKLVDIREHPLFGPDKAAVHANRGQREEYARTNMKTGRNDWRSDLYDYADIWCVFDRPREKLFYYPVSQPTLLLAELDWNGPAHGPYRFLYYEKPANHAIPISPLMHLLRKHQSYNTLDVKAIDQQQVAKWLLFYTNASKEEAERIVESYDNQSVLQENGAVRGMHIGGTSPDTVSMTEKQRSDFSYGAGGMDFWSGLSGENVETATETRLLQGTSSQLLADMQGFAEKFVKGFCEDVLWYDLRDPDNTPRSLTKIEPLTETEYQVSWTPEKRRWIQQMKFNVDVVPYSYRIQSPDTRLAALLEVVQLIGSMGQQAAAQGISININQLVNTIAKYRNLPELNDILVRQQDPNQLMQLMGGQGSGSQSMGQPRRYEMVSKSSGAGKEQAMMQAMGKPPSTQEVAVA